MQSNQNSLYRDIPKYTNLKKALIFDLAFKYEQY